MPYTTLQVYNNTDKDVCLPKDQFVARIEPIHTCGAGGCKCIAPEFTPDSYANPFLRFDGPLNMDSPPGVEVHHHYSLEYLHQLDPQLVVPSPIAQPKVEVLTPSAALRKSELSDEECLKLFPVSPSWTKDQRKKLHSLLLKRRRTKNIWSSDDWDIGIAKLRHSMDVGSAPPC